MAKTTGKNAVVSFGGTVYDCITTSSFNGTVDTAEIKCSADGTGNATTHKAVGAESWAGSVSIVLDAEDDTTASAFAPGTTGAIIYYPHGDEAGALSYTYAATSFVSGHDIGSGADAFMVLDITFAPDGSATIASP